MSTWWRKLSIRARLSIGYTATLSLLLLVYAALIYAQVYQRFSAEIDHRLDQEVEIAEQALAKDANGKLVWRPPQDMTSDGSETLANVLWIDVHGPGGELIGLAPGGYGRGLSLETLPYEARPSGFFSTKLQSGTPLRVLQRQVEAGGLRAVIRAAFAEEQIEEELASLLWVLALGLPLAVGAAGLAGYWLAGRALAPVAKMTEEARSITADRLDARLPVINPNDELGRLGTTFNELFARLGGSFEQLRRFTSDASHELRTPLAVIRSVGEVALREQHDEATYRDVIGTMLEESDRLAQLVQSLLTLARADSGRIVLNQEPVNLADLISEVANHLRVLAEEKGQQLDFRVPRLAVRADRAVLRQAVVNILDNAIKHSPPGSAVTVACRARGDRAEIDVSDQGEGIPAEHLPHVFDRFYRVDAARTRQDGARRGGFGLGLAIARWAVEAHGGQITAESTPGRGSVFRIVLPCEITPTE